MGAAILEINTLGLITCNQSQRVQMRTPDVHFISQQGWADCRTLRYRSNPDFKNSIQVLPSYKTFM